LINRVEIVVSACQRAAMAGEPAPTNDALAALLGASSGSSATTALNAAVRAGLITIERGNNSRVVAAADGTWRTAGVVTNQHWRDRAPDHPPPPRAHIRRYRQTVQTRNHQDGARLLAAALAAQVVRQPVVAPTPVKPRQPPRLGFRAEGCRFPLWGNERPTHIYCDAPRAAACMPYCEDHCRVAYQARDAA